MAINSRVTFEIYFVALAATCLRYDRRICTVTGLVATLLSATIVDRTERLRVLSTHDGLTDLYNRACFDERLVEEVLRAHRYHRPLSLAIIDLDHFKQVNDERGHVAGDAALRRFSHLLRTTVRRTDIVARFGGEEFAIILPETTGNDALAKLEQMCQQVHATAIDLPRGAGTLRLSFSAGIAALPGDAGRADDLVTRADARLLAAKAGGRNRVVGGQKMFA